MEGEKYAEDDKARKVATLNQRKNAEISSRVVPHSMLASGLNQEMFPFNSGAGLRLQLQQL